MAIPPPPSPTTCRTTCVVIELLAWLLNCCVVTELIVFLNYARKTQTNKSKKNYDLLCKVDKTNDSGA